MWALTERFEFTAQHQAVLRSLVVHEDGPGTILRDFRALVAFVREHELVVSKTNQLPPLKVLPQLNALLSKPIEVRLKRPQLKSFPHVEGLYLLLRATGLAQIGGTLTRQTLTIHPQMYEAWCALNPTEQYLTLLEAWLLHSNAEMVGERREYDFSFRQLVDSGEVLLRAGDPEGLAIADNQSVQWYWFYHPGRIGFALLELFGLMTVVARPPKEGEGWAIERIYRTPLGEAIFALLFTQWLSNFEKWAEAEDEQETSLGLLQPIFVPYVPQWQHNLALPPRVFRPGRYEFKVSLGSGLWRLIAIDGKAPLEDLGRAILSTYEFIDLDHLDEFIYRNQFGVQESVHHPYMDEGPWTTEVRVGDVPLQVGQSMIYVFDFGDNWRFLVTLQRFDADQKPPRRPQILDSHGESPKQYPGWEEEEEEEPDGEEE